MPATSLLQPVSAVALLLLSCSALTGAWRNGGDKASGDRFGTHDYIGFVAFKRAPAAHVTYIKNNLRAFFIGTEAPDTGKKVPGITQGGYHDTGACHRGNLPK